MLLKGMIIFWIAAACQASPSIYLSPKSHLLYRTLSSSYQMLKQEWEVFKEKHNKNYESHKEDMKRMEIFAQNNLFIAKHNDLYEKGVVTFTVKMNEFGDLTKDEFNQLYGLNSQHFDNEDLRNEGTVYKQPHGVLPPEEKYWCKEGAVTEVKDQGLCRSSWAFSAAGALEGQYFHKTKRLVELSKQNLIDCSTQFGNSGCEGGWPRKAFNYTKINCGIDTEKSYSYKGTMGRCRYNSAYSVTGVIEFKMLEKNENELELVVGTIGPVSVMIDARGDAFRFYEKGVHFNSTCSSEPRNLNHAVLVVGYGIEECGGQFWLVKNSWGEKWGDKGYIKMARHRGNNCGIVTEASYPII